MKVGVIGAGAWGTALAMTSARGVADVVLWSYDGNVATFDGVEMPTGVTVVTEMDELRDADVWLVATPAAFFRETIRRARPFYPAGRPIIICTKGAERDTGMFMSEILRAEMPECTEIGVLSGPQFAAEVAQGLTTGSTLAGTSDTCIAGVLALLRIIIYESEDVIGTELCGVGKNAVALICGYASVKYGENKRALLFTQAWGEVVTLGLAMGAKIETFLGLCGIGDLFLSATSVTSRNFAGGAAIARGETPSGTVEGIYALHAITERAKRMNVRTPVLDEMHKKLTTNN